MPQTIDAPKLSLKPIEVWIDAICYLHDKAFPHKHMVKNL